MRKINQSNMKWQGRVDTYRVKCFCIYFCSCFPGAALPYGCRGVCIPAAAGSEGKAHTGGAQKKQDGLAHPHSNPFSQRKESRGALGEDKWVIHKLSQWRNNPEWGFLEQCPRDSSNSILSQPCCSIWGGKSLHSQISFLPKPPRAGGTRIPKLCSKFSVSGPTKRNTQALEAAPLIIPPSRFLLLFSWFYFILFAQSCLSLILPHLMTLDN